MVGPRNTGAWQEGRPVRVPVRGMAVSRLDMLHDVAQDPEFLEDEERAILAALDGRVLIVTKENADRLMMACTFLANVEDGEVDAWQHDPYLRRCAQQSRDGWTRIAGRCAEVVMRTSGIGLNDGS